VDVQRVADPAEFAERTSGLLLQDEPRNNLILGLLGVLREQPHVYPEFSLWLVEAGDDVVGAALRTPPYGLVLGPASPAAAAALAESIEDELPGAVGVLPEIDVFAAAWGVTHDVASDVRFEQGIYSLERLREPRDVPGVRRGVRPRPTSSSCGCGCSTSRTRRCTRTSRTRAGSSGRSASGSKETIRAS
jgi:hypothetical protein